MRLLIIVVLGLVTLQSLTGQSKFLKDNEIYIVCRATKNKQSIITKDFNLKDSLITHIGLGIKSGNDLKIYNVSNTKKSDKGSSLLVESLDAFLKVDDLIAYSVWSIKIGDKINKLNVLLEDMSKRKVEFDYDFSLENGEEKLYCSEFVYKMMILSEIINNVKPTVKTLNTFYSNALKKNELHYIPVDFFQGMEGFQKVHEKILF